MRRLLVVALASAPCVGQTPRFSDCTEAGGVTHTHATGVSPHLAFLSADDARPRVNLDTSARGTLSLDGFGALVTIVTNTARWIEPIYGRTDHCTTGESGAHFGLGASTLVEALRVRWNDGTFTTLVGLATDQIVDVRAPASPADLDGSGAPDITDVLLFLEAVTDGSPVADVNGDWAVDYTDVLVFVVALGGGSG